MDGIDGLAAGVGMIVAHLFSLDRHCRMGNDLMFLSCIILSGCGAGFFIHNFHPAKIFLGDVGSSFIGYLFPGVALLGDKNSTDSYSIWIPILLLGAFIFDTGVTLIRRMMRGEKWFAAHRSHFYQRLIRPPSYSQTGLLHRIWIGHPVGMFFFNLSESWPYLEGVSPCWMDLDLYSGGFDDPVLRGKRTGELGGME